VGRRCAGRNAGTDRVTPIRLDEVCVRYVWALTDPSACPHGTHRFYSAKCCPRCKRPARRRRDSGQKKVFFGPHSNGAYVEGNGTAAEKGPVVVIRPPPCCLSMPSTHG
jgi:hypothetical protein